MVYGWLLTLPAAALFGAVAAAIALTGPFGVIVVLLALLSGTAAIVGISRRTAVNRHNVNDSRDVTVQFGRDPVARTLATSPAGSTGEAPIPPIIIRRTPVPPPANDPTSLGQQP
jgi:PiT family inorganic phosphate transporter